MIYYIKDRVRVGVRLWHIFDCAFFLGLFIMHNMENPKRF
jgi:hypothetical protein